MGKKEWNPDLELDVGGETFTLVTLLEPERSSDGTILKDVPAGEYHNARGLRMNKHGAGPFCRFSFPCTYRYDGVYAITVDRRVVYIGECLDLSQRFGPTGYGAVQPRNCYEGGQSTNCKINSFVLQSVEQGKTVELWFARHRDRKRLETSLITKLDPEWNGHVPSVPLRSTSVSADASPQNSIVVAAIPGGAQVAPGQDNAHSGGFTTYENRANPHVTIHRDGCNRIRQHGGTNRYGKGRYRPHETCRDAEDYARTTGLPVRHCHYCRPREIS